MDSLQALAGLRVLDFSHALAGPYCTLMLANYGASVYKVEAPGGNDMGRGWGPPFTNGQSSFFLALNRGKFGVAIDLKQPEGLDLCRQLASRADILVENFRPGSMERLGLGYEALRPENPRLIYCSISGYGQTGPRRNDPAMDLIVQCTSGLVSITGTESGEQVRSGFSVGDVGAGMFAVIGILMALHARERTGEGQFVDVSMQDCMVAAMTSNYASFLGSGVAPKPMGSAFPTLSPYKVFQAADRGFALAVGSEKLWSAFCRATGRTDLENHPDYANNGDRCRNRAVLEPLLDAMFGQQPATHWIELLSHAGVPCTVVRTFDEVAADAQSEAREMFQTVDGTHIGHYRTTGLPVKLPSMPSQPRMGAPLPGEHSEFVLQEALGMDAETVRELAGRGIVQQHRG
jgi:formyl-CoA transferase/CoA:oxalate CoA-transferase